MPRRHALFCNIDPDQRGHGLFCVSRPVARQAEASSEAGAAVAVTVDLATRWTDSDGLRLVRVVGGSSTADRPSSLSWRPGLPASSLRHCWLLLGRRKNSNATSPGDVRRAELLPAGLSDNSPTQVHRTHVHRFRTCDRLTKRVIVALGHWGDRPESQNSEPAMAEFTCMYSRRSVNGRTAHQPAVSSAAWFQLHRTYRPAGSLGCTRTRRGQGRHTGSRGAVSRTTRSARKILTIC